MPAKSEKQRRFFGMVYAVKTGKMKAPNKRVAKTAEEMSLQDIKDFLKKPKKRGKK